MTGGKRIKRLISCQGSIQLITALSVLSYREQEHQNLGYEYENYLVIYELYAPEGQVEQFVEFVIKMANSIIDWEKISYLTPENMQEMMGKLVTSTPPSQFFGRVQELIGVERVDEIYLSRNWRFGDELLINTYQSAEKICYGDSIGIYFSANSKAFFTVGNKPQTNWLKKIEQKGREFASFLKEKLQLKTILKKIDFDIGYFVLPEILNESPPMQTIVLENKFLLETFQKFKSLVPEEDSKKIQNLSLDSSIFILLTSNFSEARRISQKNELQAYREFLVEQNIPANTQLIIKPHPRDSHEKIQILKAHLSDLFSEIITLSDSKFFFLPFEIFFMAAFLGEDLKLNRNIRLFAVSSACLSLKLLFRVPSCIGFGEKITPRLFYEDYATGRLEHELDLKLAVEQIKG